jgi:hypothetical protein
MFRSSAKIKAFLAVSMQVFIAGRSMFLSRGKDESY